MNNSPNWDSSAVLTANNIAYEWLLKKLQAMNLREEADDVLRLVQKAGWFAGYYHTGRFADGAIENLAFNIGLNLNSDAYRSDEAKLLHSRKGSRRRVLHVTPMLAMGGHRQLLYHWISNDKNSEHSLVLLEHSGPIPEKYIQAVQSSGGTLEALPAEAELSIKASMLREIARKKADVVVWQLIGFDVAPVVAFAVEDCPPVVLIDHADHTFWLGSSVADLVVNLRSAGAELAKERRFVTNTAVLPIPLAVKKNEVSRIEARQALGIRDDQVMVLSVGRGEKYRPYGVYNFVSTANKILDSNENAHLYVVGESAEAIAPYLNCKIHDRLHFMGSVEDPSIFRAAADLYIESFPFGSQTALLEAALNGLPIVSAYAPLFPLLVANDDALLGLLQNPKDEREYIKAVSALINNPEQRKELGIALQDQLLVNHVGDGWLVRLADLYQKAEQLEHKPKEIPSSPNMRTDIDVNLSQWHVMSTKLQSSSGQCTDGGTEFYHKAFVAKTVGDYATARRYAWRYTKLNPKARASWRLLGVSIAGKMTPLLKRMLRRS